MNEKEQRHAAVMRELVNRYLMHRQMHEDNQGVTEDDLNEIKGDISAFRYELLDILRDNGMKVNSNDNFRKGNSVRKEQNTIYNTSQMSEVVVKSNALFPTGLFQMLQMQ